MASLIPGYEYDVFISYRQNDNKYDGWVKTFVTNLTLELEATVKDKVSVYFDIDPSEGLLETHSVDRSLENKLKCLIFIPILSKTYCDKNAFAWQNEFCAYNKLAKEDKFGRDIRLVKGNFASRILPVRIHELDAEDMTLVENELGASLRSIDFIYKSPGVNRPLRANEDHPKDNLNNTYYRDQINKVANSVAEILHALNQLSSGRADQVVSVSDGTAKEAAGKKMIKIPIIGGSKLWVAAFLVLAVLTIVVKLMFPSGFNKSTSGKPDAPDDRISVTVMPFRNLTNDPELDYLTVGVQDWVVTCLSFYPEEFNVRPFELVRTLMDRDNISDYSSITPFTGSMISRRLDAEFFLIGNIFKMGEIIRLNAQLINSKSEEVIVTFQEEGMADKIIYTIDSLSVKVRDYLLISKIDNNVPQPELTSSYKLHFITSSPEAYRYHALAKEALLNLDYEAAKRLDSIAVSIDSNFVNAMVTVCWANYGLGKYTEADKWLQRSLTRRDKLPLVEQINLDYHYASLHQTPEEQIKYLQQLQKIEDNNPRYSLMLGYTYIYIHKYDEAIVELQRAQSMFKNLGTEPNDLYYYHYLIKAYKKTGQQRKLNGIVKKAEDHFIESPAGLSAGDCYYNMALIYSDAGVYNKAEEYFEKGVSLNPGSKGMIHNYAFSLIDNNLDVERGLELINQVLEQDSANGILLDIKGWGLYRQHKYADALKLLQKAYQLIPSYEIRDHLDSARAALKK